MCTLNQGQEAKVVSRCYYFDFLGQTELSSEAEFLLGNLMAVLGILIEIIKLKFTNSF